MKAGEHLPIVAREGGQGQYSVSIFEGWLGSGGWAAGNLEDSMMTSCLLWDIPVSLSEDREKINIRMLPVNLTLHLGKPVIYDL